MDKKHYENLVIKISPQSMRRLKSGVPIGASRLYALKKWIGSNVTLQKLARKITAYSLIPMQEARTLKSIELLSDEGGGVPMPSVRRMVTKMICMNCRSP